MFLQGSGDADAVAYAFRAQQSLSVSELSSEVLVALDLDSSSDTDTLSDADERDVRHAYLHSDPLPARAVALSTLCGDGGAAVVRQVWHYNDLDVLSGPDYLGPECEAKLAFALLHGTDPQLVTLNALHRAGITIYRQLFAILSERSPLPEQRWIDMVMQQRGEAPGPSFVPFGAGATPQGVAPV